MPKTLKNPVTSSDEQNQPDSKQSKGIKTSDYLHQYLQNIPTLSNQKFLILQSALKNSGFYRHSNFCDFKCKVEKASIDSIQYTVRFGFFSTTLNIFIADLDFKAIQRQVIGKGRNGQILTFKIGDLKVAAKKQLNYDSRSLQSEAILKQVFLLKFASALKVGTFFISEYAYDIIALNNTCEFLMEHVQTHLELATKKVGKAKFKDDLIENLSIMHHYHLVHCDIKPENIGWSPMNKKFIFLDFGLSIFIPENIGQKTMSIFRGTYAYASKQMANALILKEFLVDMYYNDIYGFLKICEELEKECNINFVEQCVETPKKQSQDWANLISFFQLKFAIFQNNQNDIQKILMKEKNLCFSFRKVVKNLGSQMYKKSYIDYLTQQCLKIYHSIEPQKVFSQVTTDSILFWELASEKPENCFLTPTYKNLRVLFLRGDFEKVWKQPRWMEIIFDLLYCEQRKNLQPELRTFKKELLIKICSLDSYFFWEEASEEEIYAKCLEMIEGYFLQNQNLEYLFQMKEIYQLLFMFRELTQLKMSITKIVMSKNSPEFSLSFLKNYLIKMIVKNPMLPSRLSIHQHSQVNYLNLLIIKFLKELILIDTKKNFEIQIQINHLFDIFLEIKQVVSNKLLFTDIEILFYYYCQTLAQEYFNITLSKTLDETSKNYNYDKLQDIITPSKHIACKCLRNLREAYSEVRKLNEKEVIKQINKKTKKNPVLSMVNSLWNVGVLFNKGQIKRVQKLMISYFTKSDLQYTFLFILCGTFMPILQQILKISETVYEAYRKWIKNINLANFNLCEQLKLEQICLIITHISISWRNLPEKKQGLVNSQFSRKIITISFDFFDKFKELKLANPEIQQIFSNYLSKASNILKTIYFEQELQNFQENYLQLVKLQTKFQEYPQFQACYHLPASLSTFIANKIPAPYKNNLQQIIFDKFKQIKNSHDISTMISNREINRIILSKYLSKNQIMELQQFVLDFGFKSKKYFSKFFPVDYERIYSLIHPSMVEKFSRDTLEKMSLSLAAENFLLSFILYTNMIILNDRLTKQIQYRFVKMIAYGLPKFCENIWIRIVFAKFIYRWHRYNKKLPIRSQTINLRHEARRSEKQGFHKKYINMKSRMMKMKISNKVVLSYLLNKITRVKEITFLQILQKFQEAL